MTYNNEVLQGEVITPEEWAQERGTGNSSALIKLLENPGQLRGLFNLDPTQARNVKALLTGVGTAASLKYLGKYFGDELAAIAGAAVSAYAARKIFE